ncbi:MAG: peptidylprolyl isomerase [Nitrospinaceae bacterium]|nr:MAG: peptidylprolyl isomerase [Nitrospinaceae bacterium]
MIQRILFPLFAAILLLTPGMALAAEASKEPFKINGKPVPEVIAKVNGTDIRSDFLEREMVAFKLMSTQQGKEIKPESEDKIARKIVEKEIDEELIYQKARLAGIQIPSEIILKEIKNIENQFPSPEFFERALAMQHLTRGTLREKIERQLVAEKYLRQVIVPKVKMEDLAPEEYYENNKTTFMKPEMYEVSHIFVSTINPSTQGQSPDPAAKKKAQRILDGINKEARDKIDGILRKLEKGEDFGKLAKKYSEDEATSDKGGSLGTLLPQSTVPEIAEAMQKLTLGETSKVIKSSFGFHVIKLNDKVPSQLAPYDEVKADILNLLLVRETEKLKGELLAGFKKTADIKYLFK